MGKHWDDIKAMPTMRERRFIRRVTGQSLLEVERSIKPAMLTGKELRKRRDSTRRKRAKAQRLS